MKTIDIINNIINRLPAGYVFTYSDFYQQVNKIDALTKALSRLLMEGKIRKLSPGRFYKPRITEFGELGPEPFQIVKDILEKDDKIIGYLTGISVYNQLGLTTQVSSIIQIGVNDLRKNITRGIYKIGFIKQQNRIVKENIPLLRILDAIRFIKEIPDATIDQSCKVIGSLIKNLDKEEQSKLIKLALKYNPATRALTGSILENISGGKEIEILFKSLNPSSSYAFGIKQKSLPNKQKWSII